MISCSNLISRVRILIQFVFLIQTLPLFAQYQFEQNYLDVDNGLSQNVVNVLKQDSKGFLWIGTDDGLNRYDGSRLSKFLSNEQDSNSLWGNSITTLFEDATGTIWIGKGFLGISSYDRYSSRFKNYLTAQTDSGETNIGFVRKILQDHQENIWVLSSAGLFFYDARRDVFVQEEISFYTRTDFQKQLTLFSAGSNKLIMYVPNRGFFEHNRREKSSLHLTPASFFKTHALKFISKTATKEFAFVVDSTVYTYRIGNANPEIIWRSPDLITAFHTDNNGNYWVGSYDMKVFHLTIESGKVKLSEISKKFKDISKISTIRSFEMTNDGTVWVGTNGAGISRIVSSEKKFGLLQFSENVIGSIYNQSIRGILPLNAKNILIGGYSGLEQFNLSIRRSTLLLDYAKPTEHFVPYFMLQESTNPDIIWIATEGSGLLQYNLVSKRLKKYSSGQDLPSQTIRTIFRLKNGSLLCGTLDGIKMLDKDLGKFLQYSNFTLNTKNIEVRSITYIGQDEIWAGTAQSGIFVFDSQGLLKRKIDISLPSGLQNRNSVNHILFTKQEAIWVSTGAGLAHLSPEGEVLRFYTRKDGLPNNNIYGTLSDREGNLWCSTNNGISRLDISMQIFTNYSVQDGLQSTEFNRNAFASLGDSILYFGGLSGVNYFNPSTIRSNKLSYSVFIHGLRSANLNINTELLGETDQKYELSSDDRELRITVSSPIYQNPNETSFYYFLDGYSAEWKKFSEENSLLLQNIPYGNYTLRLIRATPDNLAGAPVTSVMLSFIAPFYLQTWFLTILIILFLTVGPGLYYSRTRQLIRERSIAQHFSQKLIAEQETERKRVAYALHDSLGQQLSVLKMKTRRLNINNTEKDKTERDEILFLLAETIEDVRKISHNLHPHLLEKIGLTKSLESLLTSYSELAPCKFNFTLQNIDHFFDREESLNLYRLIQEALNNITKHSKATHAGLTIELSEEEVTISIQDNGVGIDFTRMYEYESSLGIKSMYERANFIKARLHYDLSVKKGTKLCITKNLYQDYGKNKFSSTRG